MTGDATNGTILVASCTLKGGRWWEGIGMDTGGETPTHVPC